MIFFNKKTVTAFVLTAVVPYVMYMYLVYFSPPYKSWHNSNYKTHLPIEDEHMVHKNHWIYTRNISLKTTAQRKLLLFCYMRGGSTFFSEFFRTNPQVMYWYEPLDAFYSATYGQKTWHFPQDIFWQQQSNGSSLLRRIPQWEHEAMAIYNHNLLSCNFSLLPTETLLHRGLWKANLKYYLACIKKQRSVDLFHNCRLYIERKCNKCHEQIRNAFSFVNKYSNEKVNPWKIISDYNFSNNRSRKTSIDFIMYAICTKEIQSKLTTQCLPRLEKRCKQSKIVAYKGLRITMDTVEQMLQTDPDLHVIYFTRDPRSIVTSRVEIRHTYRETKNNPVLEANYLCRKMLHDYKKYLQINSQFPGAIKLVKYEDLVKHPYSILKSIYKFVGVSVHKNVYEWLRHNQRVSKSGGVFSTNRANSSRGISIDKWKKNTSEQTQKNMTNNCKEILHLLGYI